MSVLFCDSNCELWFSRQEDLGIKFIRMPYAVNGVESYYDLGKATDFEGFYNRMKAGDKVTTSALNANDYCEYFEPFLEKGEDILYLTFSHKMSATFNQMDAAIAELKEKYPERTIRTFDTKSISIGAGVLVWAGGEMHKAGASDDEIIAKLEELQKRNCLYFTPDKLDYLMRGGRLSKGKAIMGTLFNVKPMLSVTKDGMLDNYAKVNGRKKALREIIQQLENNGVDTDYPVQIIEADAKEDADMLEDMIRTIVGTKVQVWRQPIGPVVCCHCGPGTIGMSFIAKQK